MNYIDLEANVDPAEEALGRLQRKQEDLIASSENWRHEANEVANAAHASAAAYAGVATNMNSAEQMLIQGIRKSKEEMAAKKTMADALGVSTGVVTRAMADMTAQLKAEAKATEESALFAQQLARDQKKLEESLAIHGLRSQRQEFADSKHEMREFAQMGEHLTGVHAGLGRVISTAMNPAMLGMAAGALVVGEAVKLWQEEERKLAEALKEADRKVLDDAKSLETLKEMHVKLSHEETETIARAGRIKALDMADQWGKIGDSIEHLDTKQKLLNATTGESGVAISALLGPLPIVIGLWAKLTGKAEEYNDQMERLKASENSVFGVQEKNHRARLQLVSDEQKNLLASLPPKERAQKEHEDRITKIIADAHRARLDPKEFLAAEDARYKTEEAKAAEHGAKKGEREYHAWKKWQDQEVNETRRAAESRLKDDEWYAVENAKLSGNQLAVVKQQYINEEQALYEKLRKQLISNEQYMRDLALLKRKEAADEDHIRSESAAKDIKQNDDRLKKETQFLSRFNNLLHRNAGDKYKIAIDEIEKEKAANLGNLSFIAQLNQTEKDLFAEKERAKVMMALNSASGIISSGQQLFGSNKAFAYAETVVNTAKSIMAVAPNYALMAVNAVMGAAQLAKISSTEVKGQAHDGMDRVPSTGTYRLEGGEMMIDRFAGSAGRTLVAMAAEHYKTMKSSRQSGGMGGGITVVMQGNVIGARRFMQDVEKGTRRAQRYGRA